jgi:DNA-directed RNA polymerase II subunit RPB2
VSLQDTEEVRLLFPNEARLRNLTYSSVVLADIFIRVTVLIAGDKGVLEPRIFEVNLVKTAEADDRIPLFRMPIMLQSRYCVLHSKPADFMREAGECE